MYPCISNSTFMHCFAHFFIGLLHVGDIIKEINGKEVTRPEELMDYMRKASGSLTLKILPSYYDQSGSSQVKFIEFSQKSNQDLNEMKLICEFPSIEIMHRRIM